MPNYVPVTLQSITGEVVAHRFQNVLRQVLEDVADPGKKAEAAREITIKLKITPDDTRQNCKVEGSVTASLAKSKPVESHMQVALTDEGPTAKILNARQLTLQEQLEEASGRKSGDQEA